MAQPLDDYQYYEVPDLEGWARLASGIGARRETAIVRLPTLPIAYALYIDGRYRRTCPTHLKAEVALRLLLGGTTRSGFVREVGPSG